MAERFEFGGGGVELSLEEIVGDEGIRGGARLSMEGLLKRLLAAGLKSVLSTEASK